MRFLWNTGRMSHESSQKVARGREWWSLSQPIRKSLSYTPTILRLLTAYRFRFLSLEIIREHGGKGTRLIRRYAFFELPASQVRRHQIYEVCHAVNKHWPLLMLPIYQWQPFWGIGKAYHQLSLSHIVSMNRSSREWWPNDPERFRLETLTWNSCVVETDAVSFRHLY